VRPNKSKTYSCSSGTACIEGNSTGSAYGVYGTSSGVHGIYGQTTTASGGYAGVYGIATANGYGVYGASSDTSGNYAALDAYGVNSGTNLLIAYNNATKGKCTMDSGADLTCTGTISGQGTFNGVIGESSGAGAAAVLGSANGSNGYGVYAQSSATGSDPALAVVGVKSQTNLVTAFNDGNNTYCNIDSFANLTCSGEISGDDVRTRQPTSSGERVLAYAPKAASPTMEDVGTAQIVDGVANVHFEADFASTIDRGTWYYVFLTPLGDTRGLYVSRKTASGFQVRETERGRSTLEFDYRIVARPLGAKNERLPIAPALRIPKPVHRAH
jgi:hypothetical protein